MSNTTADHFNLSSVVGRLEAFGNQRFLTTRDIYQGFLDLVVELCDCQIGYLHRYQSKSQEIELNVWSTGVYDICTASHDSHYPLRDAGIWADAIRQDKTVIHNDYTQTTSAHTLPDGHCPLHNHMSTPIHGRGEVVAVIGLGNKVTDFTDDSANELERITKLGWPVVMDRLNEHAGRASSASLTYSHRSPEDVLSAMVKTVSKALELRDEYTSHHQSNVATLAEKIASMMGLPKEQCFGIHLGALVHDIGKIAIPSQILSKPGKLNSAEIALVKMHPVLGAEIFDDVDLPWPIVDIIYQHHERMDGTGYPDGLIGHSICLEARIIAVADTFDAMASDRPYRHAPGKTAAIDVLKRGRGSQFDSDVVDAFLMSIDKDLVAANDQLYGYAG